MSPIPLPGHVYILDFIEWWEELHIGVSGDLHTDANEAIADSGVEQVTKLFGAFFFFVHRVLCFFMLFLRVY